ncbi:MAG: sulfite exporter TauE/SafE family protein [Pseudomonadota bacterium]
MDAFIESHGLGALLFATAAFFLGGFVKGGVGFALPLVAVTLSASVLPAQAAVGILIIPVFLTNLWQTIRHGLAPLMETAKRFWILNLVVMVVIWFSAGLLPGMDDRVFFAILGVGVSIFAGLQLFGWRPVLPSALEKPTQFIVGLISGFFGGIAGIWGPPVVLMLGAMNVSKQEHVRASGLCFFLGALVLAPAHLTSGVLNSETLPISAGMVIPALLGMWLGFKAHDRLDVDKFRKLVLIVLVLTALNLIRRALM